MQLACTHSAAMVVLARLGPGHGSEKRVAALGSAAARLLTAYVKQVELLRRLRHGGTQIIRIERVDVHDGGQAVVGIVEPPGEGTPSKSEEQPHAQQYALEHPIQLWQERSR